MSTVEILERIRGVQAASYDRVYVSFSDRVRARVVRALSDGGYDIEREHPAPAIEPGEDVRGRSIVVAERIRR